MAVSHAIAPCRNARPTDSTEEANSANVDSFAIVALPRRARAIFCSASASGPVGVARNSSPSICSTYSLASRTKKSRNEALGGELID